MDATADDFRQQKHGKNLLAESIMEIPRALLRGYCTRSMVRFGSCLRIVFGSRENEVCSFASAAGGPARFQICTKFVKNIIFIHFLVKIFFRTRKSKQNNIFHNFHVPNFICPWICFSSQFNITYLQGLLPVITFDLELQPHICEGG